MTRIEYIRLSHRHTNRKIRERLQAVRTRLDAKSRWLGGAWQVVAWVLYSIVSVVSWLAFAAEMFKDNRFSLHYMECEIEHRNLSAAEARQYIADKSRSTTVGWPTAQSRPRSSAASTRRSSIFPPVIRRIRLRTNY